MRPESYDIGKLFDVADYELTPVYPTSRLAENKSESLFLIEATHDTTDYINGLMRLQLIDEIILYTVPFIAGTGCHLFKANLPTSNWNLVEKKEYNGGILRTIIAKEYPRIAIVFGKRTCYYVLILNRCSDSEHFLLS